jgi:hypothetical protein
VLSTIMVILDLLANGVPYVAVFAKALRKTAENMMKFSRYRALPCARNVKVNYSVDENLAAPTRRVAAAFGHR